ncbi:hypothetical protein EXE43_27690, partial [Halorubrum sp. SS5]
DVLVLLLALVVRSESHGRATGGALKSAATGGRRGKRSRPAPEAPARAGGGALSSDARPTPRTVYTLGATAPGVSLRGDGPIEE